MFSISDLSHCSPIYIHTSYTYATNIVLNIHFFLFCISSISAHGHYIKLGGVEFEIGREGPVRLF